MRVMTLNLQSGRTNESWNASDAYFGLDRNLPPGQGPGPSRPGAPGQAGQPGAPGPFLSERVIRELGALKVVGAKTGQYLALISSTAKVAQIAPDILAMQEVRETSQLSMVENFADQCGMPYTRFAAARRAPTELYMRASGQAAIGYGIALLSRIPIEAAQPLRLPSWHNPFRRDPKGKRGIAGYYFRAEEQRVAILALVRAPYPVVVAATHLTARREQNLQQLAFLEQKIRAFAAKHGVANAPMLLLGDLNLTLDKVQQATSFDILAQALTFPEHKPRTQIDHILGSGFRPVSAPGVLRMPIADHLGLVTDVEPMW